MAYGKSDNDADDKPVKRTAKKAVKRTRTSMKRKGGKK